jgi:Xaa-Pro dipeptidase
MGWSRDDKKLARVQALMAEEDLDALVVRAPDNVLYLTNYWCMKGYDVAVVPREGEPTLCVIEPQAEEAAGVAWTSDIRPFASYHPDDPRPPGARSAELALDVLRQRGLTGRVGLELSQGTQGADRMVGEPTVFTQGYFEMFPNAVDASRLLAGARMIKTGQEIERMRLANELAALALEHVQERLAAGMTESEVGAMWEGHVHAHGVGFQGKVEMARGFALVWSGTNIRTFTATGNGPIQQDEPTLFEIWVCADGYWCDLTKNLCPGTLTPEYDALLDTLLAIYDEAVGYAVDGAELAGLDRLIRDRIREAGYPGQPSHPVCHAVGARAHEPPYAHQAGEGTIREGMVLAIEPGIYWPGGGGLRLEDNFLITAAGSEKLCRVPDDFRKSR